MLHVLSQMPQILKAEKYNSDFISCKILHQVFVGLLLVYCVHNVYKNYHGQPLYCYSREQVNVGVMNAKCWNMGTYTYEKVQASHNVSSSLPRLQELYPGIRSLSDPAPRKKLHILQQFLWVFHAICAFSMYFPYWMWKYAQGNVLDEIIDLLKKPAEKDEDDDKHLESAVKIFRKSIGDHNRLFVIFLHTLVAYLFGMIMQLAFLVYMFGNNDWFFGRRIFSVANVDYEDWPFELATAFPSVSFCDIKFFGIGGSKSNYNALCFSDTGLANILIVATHWQILMILIPMIAIVLMWQIVDMLSVRFRNLWARSILGIHYNSTSAKALDKLSFGSVFLVLLLTKNMCNYRVCDLLNKLNHDFIVHGRDISRRLHGYND